MMPAVNFSEWSNFYIHKVELEGGQLNILVGSADVPRAIIGFEKPEAFVHFRESDFFQTMAKYDCSVLNAATPGDCGLFKITGSDAMIAFGPDYIEPSDIPPKYLISTPQECIEVHCWHDPAIAAIE